MPCRAKTDLSFFILAVTTPFHPNNEDCCLSSLLRPLGDVYRFRLIDQHNGNPAPDGIPPAAPHADDPFPFLLNITLADGTRQYLQELFIDHMAISETISADER